MADLPYIRKFFSPNKCIESENFLYVTKFSWIVKPQYWHGYPLGTVCQINFKILNFIVQRMWTQFVIETLL